MLPALKFIAMLSAAIFAGAALYVNLVEHPARMTLDSRAAALEWAPAYARGTWMQAVVPFTFLAIMPTNQLLLAPGRDLASPETRVLLERWARLHAVRTVLSLAATVLDLALALLR
jgi:Domain of unknown function (DUF1772)